MLLFAAILSTGLATFTSAFPVELDARNLPDLLHIYIPPRPEDSRGPCPALNTLANHGYIPRDGRDVAAGTIFQGFLDGFGLNHSAVAPALPGGLTVCGYLTGQDCTKSQTLANITLLAEPHAAEHDHSLSRQDYRMAYAHGQATDNIAYNATVFQEILDLIGDRTHVDFELANEIRLLRTGNSLKNDESGWLAPEDNIKPVQAFEIGFIFAVMSDPSLPDAATNPKIRVDWWHYWFANEAFPTILGWQKPNPPREVDFILSAAAAVYETTPSAIPSSLPSGALGPPGAPGALPATPAIPILPLYTPARAQLPWPFGTWN